MDETFDIWVAFPTEHAGPLLNEARHMADLLGCYVHAVITDESLGERAIALGADKAHCVADLSAFLATVQPEFVFFPTGYEAEAAHLAERLKAGLITNARQVQIDDATRALLGSHTVYDGEYALDLALTSPTKIATINPAAFPEPYIDDSRTGEVLHEETQPALTQPVRDLGPVAYQPYQGRPLVKAKKIIAVGRGIKTNEAFELAKQLAEKIGAELGGDRSARERNWIDEEHEVGLTGQEVAPDLYVAIGIRGDTVHNVAITGAKRVIAIHTNPNAPIFKVADQVVVAEPLEVLKELVG